MCIYTADNVDAHRAEVAKHSGRGCVNITKDSRTTGADPGKTPQIDLPNEITVHYSEITNPNQELQIDGIIGLLENQLAALKDFKNRLGNQRELSESGRAYRAQEVTKRIKMIIEITEYCARDYIATAILAGDLSRKKAADLLHVHQATVGRWVREKQQEPTAPPQYPNPKD